VSERVEYYTLLETLSGHFRDESLQTITFAGTDNKRKLQQLNKHKKLNSNDI